MTAPARAWQRNSFESHPPWNTVIHCSYPKMDFTSPHLHAGQGYSGAIFKRPPPAELRMSQKKRCAINNIYVPLLHLCTCRVSSLMDDCCVCGKRFFPFLATLTMHAKVNNVNSSWLACICHAAKYPLTRAMAPHLTPTGDRGPTAAGARESGSRGVAAAECVASGVT